MSTTADKTYDYEIEGHRVAVIRRRWHVAYPKNGNAHNPTVYYRWDLVIDGKSHGMNRTRTEALANAAEDIKDMDARR